MHGAEMLVPLAAVLALFIGLPWIVLHYVTRWKQAGRITNEDEKLLDDLYGLARRLEDRLVTVERLVALDQPEPRSGLAAPARESFDLARRN